MTTKPDSKADHGGARPGAGRPRTVAKPPPATPTMTPLAYLLAVMRDLQASQAQRIRAARAALPYCHAKAVAGKRDAAADAAKRAGTGRFAPAAAPKLVVSNPRQER